jgi:hypothetical protein
MLAHRLLLDDQVLVKVGAADFPAVEQRVVGDDAVELPLELLGEVIVGGPRVAELQNTGKSCGRVGVDWQTIRPDSLRWHRRCLWGVEVGRRGGSDLPDER